MFQLLINIRNNSVSLHTINNYTKEKYIMYSKYNQFNIFTNIFYTSQDRQGQREVSTLLNTYYINVEVQVNLLPRGRVGVEKGCQKSQNHFDVSLCMSPHTRDFILTLKKLPSL